MAEQQHGGQCGNPDEVKNRSLVENQVIVQPGQRKHQHEADDQPAHLFHVHAVERTAMRCGIDLDHAESTNRRQDGQQPPIVIA